MTYPDEPQGPQHRYTPPGPPPPVRRKRRWPKVLIGIAAAFILLIVIEAVLASLPSGQHHPTAAPAESGTAPVKASPKATAEQTVTYHVSGSPADVTYGPSGTDLSGRVPMTTSALLDPNASYYSISAQLQGTGGVSCSISVNGKVVDQEYARGSYNIAQCEISTDPITGKWVSTNG